MINVRRSNQRGGGDFGWLKSQHTFSFGNYYDKEQMGFSALRVINDDRVAPDSGFQTHGHSDMEIISYVLSGEIAHKDSAGNIATLPPGEFQLMSAGSGIRHSEFNPSKDNGLHFLQIWIQPNAYGQAPGYQQKDFGQNEGLTLVASPDGKDGSMVLKQDAFLYQLILAADGTAQLPASENRKYYVHVIDGELKIDSQSLAAGDGAKIENIRELELVALKQKVKALVFDLP